MVIKYSDKYVLECIRQHIVDTTLEVKFTKGEYEDSMDRLCLMDNENVIMDIASPEGYVMGGGAPNGVNLYKLVIDTMCYKADSYLEGK